MEIAYSLASEELHPTDMVHAARRSEELGFQSVWLSDHFHPWTNAQGQSAFVWSVLGAIAHATDQLLRLRVGVVPDAAPGDGEHHFEEQIVAAIDFERLVGDLPFPAAREMPGRRTHDADERMRGMALKHPPEREQVPQVTRRVVARRR